MTKILETLSKLQHPLGRVRRRLNPPPPFERLSLLDLMGRKADVIVAADKNGEHISLENLKVINERKKVFQSRIVRLSILQLSVLSVLIAAIFDVEMSLNVYSIRFSIFNNLREILLLFVSILGLVSIFYWITAEGLQHFIDRSLDLKYPGKYRAIYDYMFKSDSTLYGVLFPTLPETLALNYFPNLAHFLIGLCVLIATMFLAIFFAIANLVFTFIVIRDVWLNPSLPVFWNISIVLLSIAFIISSIAAGIVLIWKARYVDMKALQALRDKGKISRERTADILKSAIGERD